MWSATPTVSSPSIRDRRSYLAGASAIATPNIRFDVINLADHKYEIRDSGGVGVGVPQYGPRRGVFFGISKAFG